MLKGGEGVSRRGSNVHQATQVINITVSFCTKYIQLLYVQSTVILQWWGIGSVNLYVVLVDKIIVCELVCV